jgi:hypothetical protein
MRAKWRKKRVRRLKRKRRKTRARRYAQPITHCPSSLLIIVSSTASKLVNCSVSVSLSTPSTILPQPNNLNPQLVRTRQHHLDYLTEKSSPIKAVKRNGGQLLEDWPHNSVCLGGLLMGGVEAGQTKMELQERVA